jgi:hypothetical protein
MSNKLTRYAPEVRERAVRMVLDHQGEHSSQWAAITSVAGKIGCKAETLRTWVRRAERDSGLRPGLTPGAFYPPEGRIWISTPDLSCAPGNPSPSARETPTTMWVIVSGTFQTGDRYGHLGLFSQQIAATSIEPASDRCVAEDGS